MGHPKNRPVIYADTDAYEVPFWQSSGFLITSLYFFSVIIIILFGSTPLSKTLTLYPESILSRGIKVDEADIVDLLDVDGELYLVPDDMTPTTTSTRYTVGVIEDKREKISSKKITLTKETFLLVENITVVENLNDKEKRELTPYDREAHLQNFLLNRDVYFRVIGPIVNNITGTDRTTIEIIQSPEDYDW